MENRVVSTSYQVPDGTRIGHVHLKVSRLDRALAFYQDLLGFRITERYAEQAVFLASGDYHHLALNTWQSLGAPLPRGTAQGYSTWPFVTRNGKTSPVSTSGLSQPDTRLPGRQTMGYPRRFTWMTRTVTGWNSTGTVPVPNGHVTRRAT